MQKVDYHLSSIPVVPQRIFSKRLRPQSQKIVTLRNINSQLRLSPRQPLAREASALLLLTHKSNYKPWLRLSRSEPKISKEDWSADVDEELANFSKPPVFTKVNKKSFKNPIKEHQLGGEPPSSLRSKMEGMRLDARDKSLLE